MTFVRFRSAPAARAWLASIGLTCSWAEVGHADEAALTSRTEPGVESKSEAEVEVSAELPGPAPRDPTAASSVIRRETLEEPGLDAAHALARIPGVQTTRAGTSADVATLSIRGADSAQIPVYVAGVRLQDEATGVSDLSRVPLWMMDRVEIYRGTSPEFASRFGLGGAVFFEPRRARGSKALGAAEFGSFGSRAFTAAASVSSVGPGDSSSPSADAPSRSGGPSATSSVSYRYSAAQNDFTFRDDGGTAWDPTDDREARRINADFEAHDVWSISRFEVPTALGLARTDVVLNAWTREQGVTGLSSIQAERARSRTIRALGGAVTRVPCSSGHAENSGDSSCEITWSARGALQRQTIDDPWGELGLGGAWLASNSERAETRASLRSRAIPGVTSGVDLGFETGTLALDEPSVRRTRATEHVLGGTALVEFHADRLDVLTLVRLSCLDVSGSEAGVASGLGQCFVEGRLGARHHVTDELELRANLLRAVRPPTLGERYGVTAGTRGNSALAVEQGGAFDLGARYEDTLGFLSFAVEAFGFARLADDLIAYQRSALGYVRPYNVGQARFVGTEVSGALDAWRHLGLRGHVTWLDPRDVSSGRTTTSDLIPLLSRLTAVGEIEGYTSFEDGFLARLGVVGSVLYRGGRVADPAGLLIVPEQVSADVSLVASSVRHHFTTRFRIENVFDASLLDVVGYPLPGRAYWLGVELEY